MNLLDKDRLLLALKGQYRADNPKAVWIQEVPETVAELFTSSLKIEGPSFDPFSIPFRRQV